MTRGGHQPRRERRGGGAPVRGRPRLHRPRAARRASRGGPGRRHREVPAHAELVEAALAAGKHVYCEWPLARTTEEAAGLTEAAHSAGVHHVIGLQARYAPAVAYARDLVAEGRLGRVTSATVYAARGKGARGRIPGWAAYTLERDNGAGTLEAAGGHTLDALQYMLGGISELSAGLSVQHPVCTVAETGEVVEATSPDHLVLAATLGNGAVVSAHIHDAGIADARTRLDIAGTEGDMALVSTGAAGPAGIQIGELRLLGTAPDGTYQQLPVPDRYRWADGIDPAAEGFNVAQMYRRLAQDLRPGSDGTPTSGAAPASDRVPGFDAGLRLHQLLDTIRLSAATGTRRPTG
ncbi:Gfo/Idh/MocA family oxidoreductase [Streptomyces smyrnaeus]|uniref:Gfo/Idh/MocA family oxidoreductase n=1 Tax=Streptomyces smyrnaeus TaxID=1387713 RepID=A0ABS3XYK7_9ACTN|nr:Gfo/Idh/MocA family oxidoreductase [Streptomyces smyrnaeus]